MAQPLVIAYHLIWTAYGWWLPNDPRGSGSKAIASDVLAQLGEVHFGRKAIQPAGHIVGDFYEQAADKLKYPLLTFSSSTIDSLAQVFEDVMQGSKYTCYACAIMPDHVHVVIRKHRDQAETMMGQLKEKSAHAIRQSGVCVPDHPVWAGGQGWKVFLYHPDDVERTIRYVQNNPHKSRLPEQAWPFVTGYDRWPLHQGHSPNSPYARGLRAVGRYP